MHNIWANKSLNIPVSSGISMIFKSLERVANFKINTNTLTVQKKTTNKPNKKHTKTHKTRKNTQNTKQHKPTNNKQQRKK